MKVGRNRLRQPMPCPSFRQYVAQALDFIDFHIYPVNLNFRQSH
jgi:hypothetical protein